MSIEDLKVLFERDLDRLFKEVDAFNDDQDLWIQREGITNTGGNLALHICGNLQHFVGHIIGGRDYVRDRNFEFSATGLKRTALISEIKEAKSAVSEALSTIDANQLKSEYPLQVFGYPMTTGYFLMHLSGHLNYHLGQINYYRRLTEN